MMKKINLLPPKNSPETNSNNPKKSKKKVYFLAIGLLLLIVSSILAYGNYVTNSHSQTRIRDKNKIAAALSPQPVKKIEPKIEIKEPEADLKDTVQSLGDESLPVEENKEPDKIVSVVNNVIKSQAEKKKEEIIPLEQREYYLSIGTYRSYNEAKSVLQKLNSSGFEAYQEVTGIGQSAYQVYVECKPDFESAKKMEIELQRNGFETYLEPQKDKKEFKVRTGIFNKRSNAQNLLERLQKKGYTATIIESQTQAPEYEIKIAKFQTYQSAKVVQNKLKSKGYDAILLLSIQ